MGALTINVQEKSLSEKSLTSRIAFVLFLLVLGVGIAFLRDRIRIPLHLPGRHGVEVMFMLTFLRIAFPTRWSGSILGTGAGLATFIPGMGFGDPFMALMFFLPGLLLDLFFMGEKFFGRNLFVVALAAGLCYLSIPMTRSIITIFGVTYGSFMGGFIYPFFTHFIFGAAGGFLGASFSKILK